MNTRVPSLIQRFFGPVSDARAAEIAERLLDSKGFMESLIMYLSGESDARELAYHIQVLAEFEDQQLSQDGPCDLDALKAEREERMRA